MVLHIEDREIDWLARRLAKLTGESVTDAVKAALRDRLDRERRRAGKPIDYERLNRLIEEFKSLPIADDRPPDELLVYDDRRLPTG